MDEPFERLPDGCGIMDQCNTDVIRARIGSVMPGVSQVGTGYDLDSETFP